MLPILQYENKPLNLQKFRVLIVNDGETEVHQMNKGDILTSTAWDDIKPETSIYFDKIVIKDQGIDKLIQHQFLFKIGKEVIAASTQEKMAELPISNELIRTINEIHPFFYYNQMTLGKPDKKNNKYVYHLEKYTETKKVIQQNSKLANQFGKAGVKGIFATFLKQNKKESAEKNFEDNNPLHLVFFGNTFHFLTHKLSFEDFDINNLLGKEFFEPDSEIANWFGESAKNGVVIIKLAAPTPIKKASSTLKKQSSYGLNDPYELNWGNHPLPLILNKETNSTTCLFMTKLDFEATLKNPFELLKNGKKLRNKTLNFTLFNKDNGSSWGIDKNGGEKYQYWDFLKGDYAHFELNSTKKSQFSKNEIQKIKTLAEEGWLMTIRSEDEYQLYTSVSLLPKGHFLLERQFEPFSDVVPIQIIE